ncbi:MAG: putative toxin-antitoxin system toxin component, PIN family [Xanthomonadaceae bacterium]|nr:putative toxin-antitoxin system toxin component, PIN family [Xanthomonadaceae bacterium]
MQRIVFDTNVVLSALVFRNAAATHLRHAWQHGSCLPLVSTPTVEELLRVLAYPKFRLRAEDQHELLADYLPWTRTVHIPQPPPAVPDCRDPFDIPFLHLAAAGRAKTLVTGDRDLLALQGKTAFAILAPTEFLAQLHAD